MFSHFSAGARAFGMALLAAAVLTACGSDDNAAPATQPTPAATKVVVDTSSATPVAGGTLTLKATLLAADGSEVKGASFAWTSSDESVAVVTAASDKAPAGVSASVFVGTYATVQTRNAGEVDITATATLADGTRATSVTHLVVQAAPAKSYTLTLSPANLTLTAGAAAQTVTAAVRRSDGVDGIADLTNWTWTTADATFPVTPAADGHSAQVSSPSSATLAGSAVLAACADAPTGTRLCANAALARPAAPPPPTYTVGGTVSNLAVGKSLMLGGPNGDTALVSASGAFSFPTALVAGVPYAVTVTGQPAGQTCTVQNGSGTIAAANVTNVAITCVQAQFVVVANRHELTLSVYRTHPETGALTAVPGSPFPTLVPVSDIAFLPSGRIGYAVMADNNLIFPFELNAATGALTPMPGASVPSTPAPQVVAVDPTGRWLYVGALGMLTSYAIQPLTYGLTSTSVIPASVPTMPAGIAVSPNGQNVYATNIDLGHVWRLAVDPATGGLASGSALSSFGVQPTGVAVSPNGSTLYFTNLDTGTLGIGTLNAAGEIVNDFVMPTWGTAPIDIALAPSGQFGYVLDSASGRIETFQLGGSGAPVSLGVTNASANGLRLRITTDGRFLYTPSFNGTLYGFAINAASGALTPVPGSPFVTGNNNVAMAIVQPTP
ncbi:hypothetical protein LMG19282_00179 [Cupriavidus campinensis]|uniref:Uncharacterized protein n=2 Tax=Cupriavidus campinensis TaxID=151783 RepID=A0ABY3EMG7_9BURK|nr:hypothetical protein FGG12_14215 [Cupriavidus campinensis]CAG2129452.1 hypothetical protein LMG19282_00179 [Cupriavidus campinensis]